ncbi:MAG: ribose-phosphate pyrophosphokinase [Lachnospiraceae bacterium]|jgi:ribose-phosphate pyrophosphokinase|nr:ribose-phosphate pyrophosphokinase [Lachnospiraceae bacterium]MCI9106624.1 ribose-phosphate pyrophosphokinase [Lachnospiraceae bacterium]MCI9341376.1 ribose-phosphate pyrophosphokinase [Lachnospiraceae bacterium]GFH92190.1 ribose-phosphate pyrophosphokinase [Lachnospiraceae bacterium]
MPNLHELEAAIPVAPLKIVATESAVRMADSVNRYLIEFRKTVNNLAKNDPAFQGYVEDNYLAKASCPRFGTGEGKGFFMESIRGKDIFFLVDVCNHSITYRMNGYINHKSPDDHYQDLKRLIAASYGKAHRINVIMPFLYEGRQHKRNGRESLDCAYAIEELRNMGVSNLITFDAHDPRVQNAAPLAGFDNFTPPYQFIRALLHTEKNLIIDKYHTVVISPDEGALDRAVYFANVLGVDTGMFYKRRDYSTIINGKNPIVAHEFLGDNIDGKDVIIIDDMISSGGSMIDTAKQLKSMNAKRVFICCTFGLFTDGLKAFDEAYEKCYFDKIVTTNLTYQPPELLERPYYVEADMSKFLASIIDFMNHDSSMANVSTPTDKIQELLAKYNNREEYTL